MQTVRFFAITACVIVLPLSSWAQKTPLPAHDSSGPQIQTPQSDDETSHHAGRGVIQPPAGVDSGMHVPAPKDAGSMPVISPPGTGANPSNVVPR